MRLLNSRVEGCHFGQVNRPHRVKGVKGELTDWETSSSRQYGRSLRGQMSDYRVVSGKKENHAWRRILLGVWMCNGEEELYPFLVRLRGICFSFEIC